MYSVKVQRKRRKKLPTKLTGPTKVKVGFLSGKSGGFEIQKAIWQEYGTAGGASGGGWGGPIPERPFFRNAMRDNRKEYRAAMRRQAKKLLLGETALATVMSQLGIKAQGDVQRSIRALTSPPLSPVTIARKGSSKPLIDSGAMLGAVSWKVEK